MTAMATKVLPVSEMLTFAGNAVTRQLARWVVKEWMWVWVSVQECC